MIDIFIIPKGRTGGTLLATMLNAHSEISMGYEIYPEMLMDSNNKYYSKNFFIETIINNNGLDETLFIKSIKEKNIKIFCARAARSGITINDILTVINKKDISFYSCESRLDFIYFLLFYQKNKFNKKYIGSKMKVKPELLFKKNPNALFLMMVRDGRDVLASRLTKGQFKTTARECAHDWVDSIKNFEFFTKNTGANSLLIKYEDLVLYPEKTLSKICKILRIQFENNMVDYLNVPQSLFENSYGHLSSSQILEGLNKKSIEKWKQILTHEQVSEFSTIANEMLVKFDYE